VEVEEGCAWALGAAGGGRGLLLLLRGVVGGHEDVFGGRADGVATRAGGMVGWTGGAGGVGGGRPGLVGLLLLHAGGLGGGRGEEEAQLLVLRCLVEGEAAR
jgi:hypothetical protein